MFLCGEPDPVWCTWTEANHGDILQSELTGHYYLVGKQEGPGWGFEDINTQDNYTVNDMQAHYFLGRFRRYHAKDVVLVPKDWEMRLLVCGSRDYWDVNRLTTVLCTIHEKRPISTLIQGFAKGADRLAREWAVHRGIPIEDYPAAWEEQGRKAGPLRNIWMLTVGAPDAGVAFFGPDYTGSGTTHMVGLMKEVGIPVAEIRDWDDLGCSVRGYGSVTIIVGGRVLAHMSRVHFSSVTDLWSTPQSFFDAYDAKYHFDLDVCATEDNAKCPLYFTEKQNGLLQPWFGHCWMNPPYGRTIAMWMKKAYESSVSGCTVVCLVPARTDTKWWHDYAVKGSIEFIKGRLKFGGNVNSAPFPSAVVVFGEVVW
jgi:phage N-6-adenine-methyltransferase